MTIYTSAIPCPDIPDDLTAAQFLLDTHHPTRPIRPDGVPWLIDDASGRKVGYEEVRTRTYGLANTLHKRYGVREDDVVCIFSPNHMDYPVVVWGSHRLGTIVSCANPAYTADELAFQLETTKARILIAHPASIEVALQASRNVHMSMDNIILMDMPEDSSSSRLPTVSELVKEGLLQHTSFKERHLRPGEARNKLAFLSFSSGTTGKPKAVAISHFAVVANVIQHCAHHKVTEDYAPFEERRFRPGDISAAVLPMFHIYGLIVVLHWQLYLGLTLVVIPKFNFVQYLDSIERYKISHLFVVPPQVVLLCKHPESKKRDFSTVRFLGCGAAPLSAELTQQLVKLIPHAHVGQGYGMTETATTVTQFPITKRVGTVGSAGQLLPGVLAKVLKPDGSLAGYEEEGELVVTGPQMALRYTNNEQATRETFVDGWVRTGDEVRFARNGDLFIVDRLKEIMKVRGFQVAPAELEGHLLDHPHVDDACVVGVPDDYSGEIPFAFIVLEASAASRAKQPAEAAKVRASIFQHVADNKVQYKWLKGGIEFVDAIPKNPSGKLLRRLMRDRAKEIASKRTVSAKL